MSPLHHLTEPGKQLMDYSIGAVGMAVLFQLLPFVTGVMALALIVLRILIGLQEYKINKRDLRDENR